MGIGRLAYTRPVRKGVPVCAYMFLYVLGVCEAPQQQRLLALHVMQHLCLLLQLSVGCAWGLSSVGGVLHLPSGGLITGWTVEFGYVQLPTCTQLKQQHAPDLAPRLRAAGVLPFDGDSHSFVVDGWVVPQHSVPHKRMQHAVDGSCLAAGHLPAWRLAGKFHSGTCRSYLSVP